MLSSLITVDKNQGNQIGNKGRNPSKSATAA